MICYRLERYEEARGSSIPAKTECNLEPVLQSQGLLLGQWPAEDRVSCGVEQLHISLAHTAGIWFQIYNWQEHLSSFLFQIQNQH